MLKLSQSYLPTNLSISLWRDRNGDVAALFGLMAIVLFLTIGGAVDFGRWLHARNQTMNAMDAAVLAAGRTLQVGGDANAAVAAAQAYYTENVQGRLTLESDTINFVVSDDGLSVKSAGNAYIETPFLSLAHIDRLAILEENGVEYSESEIAVGGNAGINLEISMMLDVTGSMSGDKIADLKEAAKDLIEIVVWDDQSEYSSRVALVPFSEGVRMPYDSARNAARGPSSNTTTKEGWYYDGGWQYGMHDYHRQDCLVERNGAQAFTDAAPSEGAYVNAMYTYYSQNYCKPSSQNKLRPLSNDKGQLKNWVDNLTTSGGTAGHLGTAWAWYTLSPNWNSIWNSASNNAVAYGTADTSKIAILMTDGEFNTWYDVDGVNAGYTNDPTNGSSTVQARTLCTNMKAAGITVYTVGFDLTEGSEAAATMSQCATDSSKAFTAEDGEQLKQSFRAIALEISKLRLSS